MATQVDITNTALGHLGNKASVVSIDPPDGSAEANWASRFFFSAVYRTLARIDWGFARKRATLAATDLPAGCVAWRYAYTKPSDCVAPRRILTDDSTNYEDDSAAFEVEGELILTNKANAVLVYTQPITDVSKFPILFQETVAVDLAAYLSGPILRGNDGIKAASALRDMAARMAAVAAATDGKSTARPDGAGYRPGSLAARGTSSPVTESTMIYRG